MVVCRVSASIGLYIMGRVEWHKYYDMEARVRYGAALWVRAVKVGLGICWVIIGQILMR